MNKKQIAITLGCVCLVLTMAVFIQIKTINNASKDVSKAFSNNDLRDQVLRWKERYETSYEDLQNASKELEKIRQSATEDSEESREQEALLKRNNMILGLTNVMGTGVTVTMKDNNSVTVDTISEYDDISRYLVHEEDVRSIINELENAGAEAISINDQRVILATSVTCEGNVISVNGQKVSSPFIIKAIGNSLSLYSALTRPGGYVERLNSTGINTVVKQSDNINISKYSGVLSYKYMKYSN